MAFGINKLHKYARPNNWILVDRNGNFQEIREGVFDALYEKHAAGFACKIDIIRGRTCLHVYFHDLISDDSWPIASARCDETGWQVKAVKNLPEQCNLSREARAELTDRLDLYETITFFFL